MSVTPADQPLQMLRESTIDQLIANYGQGNISLEAFERRLDSALDANHHDELTALTDDLVIMADTDYIKQKKEELGIDYSNPDAKDVDYIFHIFGGGNHRGDWTAAKEIRIFSFCGGGTLDFSDAKFSSDITTIKIYCLMGGVEIYVAEGTKVNSRLFSFMGGFSNRVPRNSNAQAPTLNIDGVIIMGGATVKVRRSFREKLVELGENLRTSFGSPYPRTRRQR